MYKTIREFINFKASCPNCGQNMKPVIRVEGAENLYPQETNLLDAPDPYATVYIPNEVTYKNRFMAYKSRIEDNCLYLDSYKYFGNKFEHRVCSINIDTNQNTTHVKEFHSFLSNNTCRLSMTCYVDTCLNTCSYHYSSDKLYVDLKNNKLYTTKLNCEMFGLPFNDDYYMLINYVSNSDETTLMTKKKRIGAFPYINLTKINSAESAIRKIKTLLLFG